MILMLMRYEHDGLIWIDLESPNRDEVNAVLAEFHIAPATGDDLLIPTTRPRTEFHDNFCFLVLHFPELRHSHKSREHEIDFLIGEKFLITTHYETVDPLHKFTQIFAASPALKSNLPHQHAAHLFFSMMKALYRSVDHELDFVRRNMATIEEHIFSGEEVAMVPAISHCARDLLNMRQTIEPHREVLRTLESQGPQFFGQDFASYFRSLENEYYRVHNHIMRQTESLHELRETNNAMLTTKQNETIKVLTIMAFTTFPLTLIATIFAMDAKYMPIVGMRNDFWIILAIMALVLVGMYGYFSYKKWL